MIVRRAVATGVLAAAGVLGFLSNATLVAADPAYPPVPPAPAEVSQTRVEPGQRVTISGSGFRPLSLVTVGLDRLAGGSGGQSAHRWLGTETVSSVTADTAGIATAVVDLADVGTFRLTLSGVTPTGAPHVVGASIVVAPAPAAAPRTSGLPRTGSDLTWLYAGLGLIAGGGVLLSGTRTRQPASRPRHARTA